MINKEIPKSGNPDLQPHHANFDRDEGVSKRVRLGANEVVALALVNTAQRESPSGIDRPPPVATACESSSESKYNFLIRLDGQLLAQ